jgi:hypothetical protein
MQLTGLARKSFFSGAHHHTHRDTHTRTRRMDEWAGSSFYLIHSFSPIKRRSHSVYAEREREISVAGALSVFSSLFRRVEGIWRGYPHSLRLSLSSPETGQGEICITAGGDECWELPLCAGPVSRSQNNNKRKKGGKKARSCRGCCIVIVKEEEKKRDLRFLFKFVFIWRHQSSGWRGSRVAVGNRNTFLNLMPTHLRLYDKSWVLCHADGQSKTEGWSCLFEYLGEAPGKTTTTTQK